MTGQLERPAAELMDAYAQIDERRRFTETVLAGVSAGVIGLDREGRVDLPNRAASELMGTDLMASSGLPLAHVVPEFAALLQEVQAAPERARTAEVQVGPPANRRTLLVRVGTEMKGEGIDGFVVTFDDVTELLSAQRKAAWSDVARRIAHEIKNPLTPIQLGGRAAEAALHQGDPVRPGDLRPMCRHHRPPCRRYRPHGGRVQRVCPHAPAGDQAGGCRPHRAGEPWCCSGRRIRRSPGRSTCRTRGPVAPCDRRLVSQALTNLLMNAADAAGMRVRAKREGGGGDHRVPSRQHERA